MSSILTIHESWKPPWVQIPWQPHVHVDLKLSPFMYNGVYGVYLNLSFDFLRVSISFVNFLSSDPENWRINSCCSGILNGWACPTRSGDHLPSLFHYPPQLYKEKQLDINNSRSKPYRDKQRKSSKYYYELKIQRKFWLEGLDTGTSLYLYRVLYTIKYLDGKRYPHCCHVVPSTWIRPDRTPAM